MVRRGVIAVALVAALGGCADAADVIASTPSAPETTAPMSPGPKATAPTSPGPKSHGPTTLVPKTTAPKSPGPTVQRAAAVTSLGIPAVGVSDLRVVAYQGTADDRPGTVIQNSGVAASPTGTAGGVGPGEIGNFIVTGHRTAHGRPFGRLPDLRTGDHVLVTHNGYVYDYMIVRTMVISFRKPAEKAQQNAAVPGQPGAEPSHAMITLSTCATAEDHAQGNYWKDALDNPEHRINKIGTLVATRPAP
ncbi:MAG TPA: sortase [Kribbella sp.]|jgi:sortase A